ncbi:unnamed protein product [Hydatigera taeniaeformis]|uniref:Uncharacterized protein n=1 Tax=Hydatigena taeniaeformis TaxID=6205 RepID=A0A0R3WIM8_HYDTA|nr:unnamed protein product [Hydatigera taeniaeformis]
MTLIRIPCITSTRRDLGHFHPERREMGSPSSDGDSYVFVRSNSRGVRRAVSEPPSFHYEACRESDFAGFLSVGSAECATACYIGDVRTPNPTTLKGITHGLSSISICQSDNCVNEDAIVESTSTSMNSGSLAEPVNVGPVDGNEKSQDSVSGDFISSTSSTFTHSDSMNGTTAMESLDTVEESDDTLSEKYANSNSTTSLSDSLDVPPPVMLGSLDDARAMEHLHSIKESEDSLSESSEDEISSFSSETDSLEERRQDRPVSSQTVPLPTIIDAATKTTKPALLDDLFDLVDDPLVILKLDSQARVPYLNWFAFFCDFWPKVMNKFESDFSSLPSCLQSQYHRFFKPHEGPSYETYIIMYQLLSLRLNELFHVDTLNKNLYDLLCYAYYATYHKYV